jgi:hypothetical protein
MDAKGKIRKTYPPELVQTPLEKLAESLPDIDKQLRCAITVQVLQQQAVQMTDLQAAEQLNAARMALFATIEKRSRRWPESNLHPDRSGSYLNWKRLPSVAVAASVPRRRSISPLSSSSEQTQSPARPPAHRRGGRIF